MELKVWRSGMRGKDGRYETYEVSPEPGMTVLEALFKVQETIDDSLAFRYACRGAICGSCAMMINREMRLACRTQVAHLSWLKPLGIKAFPAMQRPTRFDPGSEVLIEPLPNLPILKDLIVDMTRFHETYRRIRPWMEPEEAGAGFSTMSQDECAKVERYGNCILCACCFGSCPVCERDPTYVGPHALAWALRFIDDVRDRDSKSRMMVISEKGGAGSCEFIYNCVRVCPKEVAPAAAIRSIRNKSQSNTA